MRTSLRWSVLALLAVTGASLGGCEGCGSKSGGGATSSSAPVASGSAPAASGSTGSRSRVGIRASGVTGAIFRAVHGLELKPEQKTELDKISSDYREAEKTARGEGDARKNEAKELQTTLSTGVKAGKLDTAKLDGIQAELEKAAKARHDREAEALNKVHAVLDPAQRSATAATVRAQEERRLARMKPAGDGGAAKGGDGGRPPMNVGGARFRLERYTKDLDLDAEQRKKVDAILPKDDPKAAEELREEAKKRSDLLLAAFEKVPFDAKKVEPDSAAKKRPPPLAESVKFLGQLIPILKPEQREKLAATLEKEREHGGHGDDHRRHRWPERGHDTPEDEDEAE